MAINRFKIALNNSTVPLLSTQAQRAVVIPGLDSAPRAARGFTSGDSLDYDMAKIIYAENVVPVAHGIRSVRYNQLIAATAANDFDSIFPLRDENENVVLYSPSRGKNYVYNDATSTWSDTSIETIWTLTLDAAADPTTSTVTYAYVDGKTFVCYSRLKSNDATPVDMSIMQWDTATQALVPSTTIVTNLPFPVGEIDGISSSSGYLIVWSGITIAWAPFNGSAFDFTIYTAGSYTGAGYQIPEDVKGPISAIIGVSGGFIAFTNKNAIGASYQAQSIASPWVFREVPNAGGLDSYEQATVEGSLGKLLAYTTTGMQAISINSADTVHPDVADFITTRQTESYSFTTHTKERGSIQTDLFTKLTAIGNRYLVLSYGYYPGTYIYALIYDLALERWGKLKFIHRDCFAYSYTSLPQYVTYSALQELDYDLLGAVPYADLTITNANITPAAHALAFLKEDGSVFVADWAQSSNGVDSSVVIIGRVQLSRGKHIQLNRIESEGLSNGTVYVGASTDGRNIDRIEETVVVHQDTEYQIAGCLVDCKNLDIIIEGTFDLSTVILEAATSGVF